MLKRSEFFAIVVICCLRSGVATAQTTPTTVPPATGATAAEQMLALGPEAQALASGVGRWDLTQTNWSSPTADPVTISGLVAERQMIGPFLQETVHPAPDSSAKPFTRIDYLTFNRVEARWAYASMDTRSSNGIMPAWSRGRDPADRIDLVFQPFAIVGSGSEVKGQMLRLEQTIAREGPDREVKDQYFTLADGVGTRWLARRYVYTRRPS